MNTKIIFKSACGMYRITETQDDCYDLRSLKGDDYNHEVNPNIPIEKLKLEEKQFEKLVNDVGVYGYTLEKWNPMPDHGWEHVDSCWGFVGSYDPNEEHYNHYIVDELKGKIK